MLGCYTLYRGRTTVAAINQMVRCTWQRELQKHQRYNLIFSSSHPASIRVRFSSSASVTSTSAQLPSSASYCLTHIIPVLQDSLVRITPYCLLHPVPTTTSSNKATEGTGPILSIKATRRVKPARRNGERNPRWGRSLRIVRILGGLVAAAGTSTKSICWERKMMIILLSKKT